MLTCHHFEVKGTYIESEKDFCNQVPELEYLGQFAYKASCLEIPGHLIRYNEAIYSVPGLAWLGDKTCMTLYPISVDLRKCKPIEDCPIRVEVWCVPVDDEAPIARYAFYNSQRRWARDLVKRRRDVDVFISGKPVLKKAFLNS